MKNPEQQTLRELMADFAIMHGLSCAEAQTLPAVFEKAAFETEQPSVNDFVIKCLIRGELSSYMASVARTVAKLAEKA